MIWAMACVPAGTQGWIASLDGYVVDERGAPVEAAEVTLAGTDGTPIGSAVTDASGLFAFPLAGEQLTGNAVVALVHADAVAEARATFPVNLSDARIATLSAAPEQTWQVVHRRLAAVRLADDAPTGTATGTLRDADTRLPVEGARLSLRQGWNAQPGDPVVLEVESGSGGRFAVEASPPGIYTVSVAAGGGYESARFPAFLTQGGGVADGWVAGPLGAGQLRATLGWTGAVDLDLHLTAPLKGGQAGQDGNGRYHVWAQETTHPDTAAAGESNARLLEPIGAGPGGETILIETAPGEGQIRLSAFDMTHRENTENTELAGSEACIQVWYGSDEPAYYTVAPGQIATWWQPAAIDVATGIVYAAEEYDVGVLPGDAGAF